MTLIEQIRVIAFTFIYGIVFAFLFNILYSFLNTKSMIINIITNFIFFFMMGSLYFYFLFLINGGIIHIYMLFLFLISFFLYNSLFKKIRI